MELFFADESALHRIQNATTTRELNHTFSDSLFASMQRVFLEPELYDTIIALQVSQGSRGQGHHPAIEGALEGGVGTYMLNADGLYTALHLGLGAEAAHQPENAILLDQVSKLNIDHLSPYSHVFLDADLYEEAPQNLAGFIDQLEQSPRSGYKFKAGFPESALIPVASAQNKGIWSRDDFTLKGDETLRLRDVPTHSVTVGCPFSFEPKDGRKLWALYASSRAGIEQRIRLGVEAMNTTGGSAESAQQTS
jgi:hypothetical protein